MDFKIKESKKDDSRTKVQQDVDKLRTCQIKRDWGIRRLEETKHPVKSIKEWAKIWL